MKQEKTTYSGRAYTWSLITYTEQEAIERLLNECKHWALCYHDKDENEDGTPKEPHTHIIATFEQQISLKSIQDIMASKQNTLGECRRKQGDGFTNLNIKALYNYLIHRNEINKYQYDITDRLCDDKQYWNRYDEDRTIETAINDEFLTDLLNPYKTTEEMDLFLARKYGRDYIKNREQYQTFRFLNITNEVYKSMFDRYELLINFCIKNEIDEKTAIEYLQSRMNFERGFYGG